MAEKVPFAALDHLVTHGPLLSQTEEFLRSVMEDKMAQSLEKLEQDAGLQVFNDIGDTDPATLPQSSALLEQRDGVTYERLAILDKVSHVLAFHGAPFGAEYAEMLATFKSLLPADAPDPILMKSVRLDLI